MPNVHTFDSTHDAYNETQWNDEIKDGDVLVIPSEGVIGFLYGAWPTAIIYNGDPGAFHTRSDCTQTTFDGKDYSANIKQCADVGNEDADITGNSHWKTV